MENNEENLAKFLVQYLGQEVKLPDGSLQILSGVSKHKGMSGENVWWFYFADEKHHCLLIRYAYLLLTPLSAITDEDAIEVTKIVTKPERGTFTFEVIEAKHNYLNQLVKQVIIHQHYPNIKSKPDSDIYGLVDVFNFTSSIVAKMDAMLPTHCYQYLQSKGYALPYMGLSVEQLIEYGWIKLKD